MKQRNAKMLTVSCLLALVFSMAGCATPQVISTASCPVLPRMPSVTQPEPMEPYLVSVEKRMTQWDKQLQDISAMLKN